MHLSKLVPVALLASLTFFSLPGTARAQPTNIAHKAQYLQGAVGAMEQKMAEGDLARVRMMVIGTALLAQSFFGSLDDPTYGPIIRGWLAAHEAGWPGQTALGPTELNDLFATIEANKTRLGQIAQQCATDSHGMPKGVMEYRRYVANSVTQREATWEFLDGIAEASPPTILLMQDQLLWQKLAGVLPYFQVFYRANFGPSIAVGIAQQRVIPEALAAVESSLSDAGSSKNAAEIWGEVEEANENLDIVSHIEVSLRGEGPPIAMPDVQKKVEELRVAVKKQDERAREIKDREIDANRMPKNSWDGSDRESMLGKLKKAYAAQFPKESVLRMVITSEETAERWESYWDGNAAVTVYVSYLTAAAAVKQPSGLFQVFKCRYVRNRKANGTWSGWRYQAHIQSYQIREKNI